MAVDGLQTVVTTLGVLPAPSITRSYCEKPESYIGCTCPRTNDGNVCHISKMYAFQNLIYVVKLDVNPIRLDDFNVNSINLDGRQLAGSRLSGSIHENISKLTDLEIL